MGGLTLIIMALLMLAIILGIPFLLIYFFYKWLVRKGYKWAGIVIVLSLISFLFFNIYTAIYPLDSFYFDDFKKVTSREIPKSALIVRKTASYPDIHGKYISCSMIKFSKQDYRILLNELQNDASMSKKDDMDYSEELNEIMEDKNINDIESAYTRSVNGRPDGRSYIGFFNDHQTIIVWYFR